MITKFLAVGSILSLGACSSMQDNQPYKMGQTGVTQEMVDAQAASDMAYTNLLPVLIGIFALAALLNDNGGGVVSTTPRYPPPP